MDTEKDPWHLIGMDTTPSIGHRLRALRDARHLTQRDVALRADIPETYVSRYERDQSAPSTAILVRLARALECRLDDIAGEP